jgi:hypothetical protein
MRNVRAGPGALPARSLGAARARGQVLLELVAEIANEAATLGRRSFVIERGDGARHELRPRFLVGRVQHPGQVDARPQERHEEATGREVDHQRHAEDAARRPSAERRAQHGREGIEQLRQLAQLHEPHAHEDLGEPVRDLLEVGVGLVARTRGLARRGVVVGRGRAVDPRHPEQEPEQATAHQRRTRDHQADAQP